jgi:putative oxidoreductase
VHVLANVYLMLTRWVDHTQPLLNLAFRLYLANVFFKAGLTKIKTWDSTLMLFEYEYAVPVLRFDVAAYLATGAELLLPVLLVLGLAGRVSAVGLFVLNVVAAISYPDISPAGINDHYFWGAMLLILTVYGPGKISVDAWLQQRFFTP